MKQSHNEQEYGEFKGSTETTLRQILLEIKELRTDLVTVTENHNKRITGLENFRVYVLGMAAIVGFAVSYLKDYILKRL